MVRSILERMILKIITKVQKVLLRINRNFATNMYYKLAKIHFKLYYGLELEDEVLNASEIAYLAAKRHSRLVLRVIYPNIESTNRKIVKHAARSTFTKNILLNAKL